MIHGAASARKDAAEWVETDFYSADNEVLAGQSTFRAAGSCFASVGECEWKIALRPPPTCYLKVWMTMFYLEGNEVKTITSLDPFEWIGGENPCGGSDPLDMVIESEWRTFPPSAYFQSSHYVFLKKYSLLQGYEPDDPISFGPGEIKDRPCPDPRP